MVIANMVKKAKVYIFFKIILVLIIVASIAGGAVAWYIYDGVFNKNVFVRKNKEEQYLFIPTGVDADSVLSIITTDFHVLKPNTLKWLMEKKNYQNNVHPGRYLITDGMSNNEMINMLRSGNQIPIDFTIKFHRYKGKIADQVAHELEASYGDISYCLNDPDFLDSLGFTEQTIIAMFIPNTYKINWNTDGREFMYRMKKEYDKFWNSERKAKAKAMGMTPVEVITMASIVDREARYNDEKNTIAGVYYNRIKKGIKLQADPTVIYAEGNFNIRRVLKKHLRNDSPYNTYKYAGLPPGPICIPSIKSIDATLNYEKHDYLFFCAKEDFSGYHNFAVTHKEHSRNAKKFQRALNKRKIYK